jgi:hypothetical protein
LNAGARISGRFRAWLVKERTDPIGPGKFSVLIILITLVSLVLYLVPHSI